MTKKTTRSTFCHPIRFDDFDSSIYLLFQKLAKEGLGNIHQRPIPLIIQLDINDDMGKEDIHVMRIFLKKLRNVCQNYFVRFRTSILWAADSDNTDIFYINDELTNKHVDAVLHLKVFDKKTIICNADVCKKTRRLHSIDVLNKTMLEEIPAEDDCGDEIGYLESIADFYISSGISDMLKYQGDDSLHVLFIPGFEGMEYHALPLYGFSNRDAKYRYLAAEKTLDFLTTKHSLVIPDKLEPLVVMEALLETIQLQVDHGDRYTLASDVYALTELLYAYHLITPREYKTKTKNEMILFQIIENQDKTTTIQTYGIEHDSVS